ncbi:MAG: hypothetical protein HY718_13820 [Planctomycetes bacterium]|nr:hypothetical protein [Planctomycetota bacterium]
MTLFPLWAGDALLGPALNYYEGATEFGGAYGLEDLSVDYTPLAATYAGGKLLDRCLSAGKATGSQGYKTAFERKLESALLDQEIVLEAGRPRLRPVQSPGKISGNPANRLIETGEPRKSGGWRRRWYTMTEADELAYGQAVAEKYGQLVRETRWMTEEAARQYRFQEMSKFRNQWLRTFLENRNY